LQVVGQPGFPVVLTSLRDDSIGAGFDPSGRVQNDTDGNGDRFDPGGSLPTGPEVNNGTLIDNDVLITAPGFFQAQPGTGGTLPVSGVTVQTQNAILQNQNYIAQFVNYVDVGRTAERSIWRRQHHVAADVDRQRCRGQRATSPSVRRPADDCWRVETVSAGDRRLQRSQLQRPPAGSLRLISYFDPRSSGRPAICCSRGARRAKRISARTSWTCGANRQPRRIPADQ
jgi:hypothetical protein